LKANIILLNKYNCPIVMPKKNYFNKFLQNKIGQFNTDFID